MLLTFASWPQEGCHGASQQVHTGARKKGQEAVPAASVSIFLFIFLMDTRAFSKPLPPADFLLSLRQGDSFTLTSHPLSHPYHGFMVSFWQHWISGFGHTTCFGQWNVRRCGVSRSLDVLSPLVLSFCPYVIHHEENIIQDVSSPRSMKDTWERSRLNL